MPVLQVAIKRHQTGSLSVPVEALKDGCAPPFSHGLRVGWVREQVLDGRGDRRGIARVHHEAAAGSDHQLAPSREVGCDDGETGRHVLEQLVRTDRIHMVRVRMQERQADSRLEELPNDLREGLPGEEVDSLDGGCPARQRRILEMAQQAQAAA